jgi:hypothetical protein
LPRGRIDSTAELACLRANSPFVRNELLSSADFQK